MSIFAQQVEALQFHLGTIAPAGILRETAKYAHVDQDMIAMMLEQAARFSQEQLEPLAARADVLGCSINEGSVKLPANTADVYRQWCELGFPALSLPMEFEGLDFPNSVQSAIQEVCDGANLSFGMLGINLRCAARVLLEHADGEPAGRWVPGLVSGEISSTIAISEPQAGSDAGRIRTSAEPGPQGTWRINGSKIWISYGDHDATGQIIHMVLARIPGGEKGTRGLGLFAVPKYTNDTPAQESFNGVKALRLEHKMGLNASPTCVLEFENAEGWLIGEPGMGIRNLFPMMNAMRLAVAVQGSAAANAATLHALAYARERPQGGPPDQAPAMIIEHADVKRMLLEMTAQGELLRALALRTAFYQDLGIAGAGDRDAAENRKISELMLPVAKTLSAELGFSVASQGIQVLGGCGYTNDYPLERIARDIRVASIYEGTSGIQALDFLLRKVARDDAATLNILLDDITASLARADTENPMRAPLEEGLASFRATLDVLLTQYRASPGAVDASAYAFLRLAGLLFCGWCATDLYTGAEGDSPYQQRLRDSLQLYARQYRDEFNLWTGRASPDMDLASVTL